jgi:hypothetical protein
VQNFCACINLKPEEANSNLVQPECVCLDGGAEMLSAACARSTASNGAHTLQESFQR